MNVVSLNCTGMSLGIASTPRTAAKSKITVVDIQRATAAFYEIPLREMVSSRRPRHIARPRQVAMYLARELTPRSLPDIGHRFGGRDHTTVMHAIATVERLMDANEDFMADVAALTEVLKRRFVA